MAIATIILLTIFCIYFPISLFKSPITYTSDKTIVQFEKTLENYFAIQGFFIVLFMILLFVAILLNSTKTNKNIAKASFAVSLAGFSYFIYVIIDVFSKNIDFSKMNNAPHAVWSFSWTFIVLIIFVAVLFVINIINFIRQMISRD
ncbi:MAG: hypothetical protein J1F31_04735 [Erysipelotrichales bacterium]|nr:hypothetical protein [Erysipelotrichales bacterium]